MYEVKKISAGILPSNTYVLYDSQTKCCAVVDPAFDGDKITKFIEEKGLKPVAVLLTHGHFDHCGGAKPIVENTACPFTAAKRTRLWRQARPKTFGEYFATIAR